MISILQSLPNIYVYFIIWGVLIIWFNRKKHRRLYQWNLVIGIGVVLLCSTSYLPKKLIHSIERTYSPLVLGKLDKSENYYIHVLGSGTSLDEKLPASMNLNATTLMRLFEGIRIHNYLDNAVLVTSASAGTGRKSQAQVAKEAAISVGIDEDHIEILDTPTTTVEEAIAFKNKFGASKKILLVTSALHMPRAIEIFKDQGLDVIPAPTEYMYKEGPTDYNGITFPSFESLQWINVYQRTILKKYYYRWFVKSI